LIEEKENMAMNIIKKGKGELFTDPDHARIFLLNIADKTNYFSIGGNK
jgi:hypothetical protein